jgi:hypothetical protein
MSKLQMICRQLHSLTGSFHSIDREQGCRQRRCVGEILLVDASMALPTGSFEIRKNPGKDFLLTGVALPAGPAAVIQ